MSLLDNEKDPEELAEKAEALRDLERENPTPQEKLYLAQFEILDGEHEHSGAFIVKAKDIDKATKIAEGQEHEPEFTDYSDEDTRKYWDYGDAETGSKVRRVTEITK